MKCQFCNKRTAERECPALGYSICPKCCGENRGTEIDCPTSCRYFRKHEKYQQKREAEPYQKEAAEKIKEVLEEEDKELISLISTLETLIYYRYFREEDKKLDDKEVLEALEKLKKHLGPIELPGEETELEKFLRSELTSLLNRSEAGEEKLLRAVDLLIEIGQAFTDENRRLVQGIIGHVREHYEIPEEEPEEREEGLITTPSSLRKSMNNRTGRGRI